MFVVCIVCAIGLVLGLGSASAATVGNNSTVKVLKPVVKLSTHAKVVKIMKVARHFRYSHRYSTRLGIIKHRCGDCWAMSAYLYYELVHAKIHARIIQYRTKWSSRHRSVQYWIGHWVNVPYRTYFHLTNMFNNTQSHGLVIAKY